MSERRDIEELLPAYVNGTLDAERAHRVETALHEDPGLAEEHRFLTSLRDELRRDPGRTPGELGWQRLRRGIERERAASPAPRRQRFRRPAAVAAAVVIMIQAVLLWRAYDPAGPAYEPFEAGRAGQIQVRFEPQATAKQIHALLAGADLEIVSGPGASGVYRLRLTRDADDAAIEAAIERLAERDAVVAHVARE